MKIFHVIDSAGIYGAEVMLLNLMQEQQNLGLSPLLCSIGDLNEKEKALEVEAQSRKLEVTKIRIPRGLKLRSALKILQDARYHKADIIHLHGYKDTILLGFLPRAMRRIPTIRTLHGWTSNKKLSKIWIYECLDRFCLRKIDAVVCVNANFSFQRAGFLKRMKIFTIENGIPELSFDRDLILREDCETSEFCKNAFVIGGIGRLSAEKGFKYLIEAMDSLLTKKPDCKLVLIGEGNQKKELERIVYERGLAKNVLMTGYKQYASKYLPIFDVFVLPSLTEGLPIVLLEAMQSKTPIVATRVGGVPGVLGEGKCGVLIEPGSSEALEKAILHIMENKDSADAMAKKAKEIALTKYSSSRMAMDYYKLYNSL
jgi:glycosyltransferase involved in cell wall biosynthesis